MKIELLYIPDCPNHSPAAQAIRGVLLEHGLPLEITEIEVADPESAAALRFPGSPTIRINGKDVEPDAVEPGQYGVSWRVYRWQGERRGLPHRDSIRRAILSAVRV